MAAGDQLVGWTKKHFNKKVNINELELECGKIFDLRSIPGAVGPKN